MATNELALILLGKGSLAEAEMHARNAIRIAPENPQAHNLMGMIMTEANRPPIGEYHYRRVLELTGQRDPILLANLAWNLKNQGRMAEARKLYEESVAAAPEIRRPCWVSPAWRRQIATSMQPQACLTGWTRCSRTTRACVSLARCCWAACGATTKRSP